MAQVAVAARITHINITDSVTVHQVAGGDSVTVYGITFSNTTSGNDDVTARTTDGNTTTLILMQIDKGDVYTVDTPFLADKGIEFIGTAGGGSIDIDLTVYHSNPGI